MYIDIHQAIELYNQACLAEQEGKANLAEVYYLKSWALFEQAGDRYYVNATQILNALAHLRQSRGNYEGAFSCVKKAVQIIETHPGVFTNTEAEVIRMQAWELIKNLLLLQEPQQKFSPAI
jgi:tetratricopeptide (TPR) repeat protein